MSRAEMIGIVVECVETDDLPDGRPVLPALPMLELPGCRSSR
jgi:hypothetical protein